MKEVKGKGLSTKQKNSLAKFVYDEFKRRATTAERKHLEDQWKEVDRQVAMEAKDDWEQTHKPWEPKFELPLQANSLETLISDTYEMRFAGNGHWFSATAAMSDEYLQRLTKAVRIPTANNPYQTEFDQADIDAITQSILVHSHAMTKFAEQLVMMDTLGMKYGTTGLRVRGVKRHRLISDAGIASVSRRDLGVIPVATPVDIRRYYPDNTPEIAASFGAYTTPLEILTCRMTKADLLIAAKKGGSNSDDPLGGWIKDEVSRLEDDKVKANEFVELIEAEGDFVVDSEGDETYYMPNVTVTVAHGKGVGDPKLVKINVNPMEERSIFAATYFKDKVGAYGVSPLMKGAPFQKMAQYAAENVIYVAEMQKKPPVWINGQDPVLKANGVKIEPGELVKTVRKPEAIDIGDLNGSSAVFNNMKAQHENSTGVDDVRQGAQTKSHQTAFAVNTETNKGQKRTVRYIRSTESFGILDSVLHRQMAILRQGMNEQLVYIKEFDSYIMASGQALPDEAVFKIKGAAAQVEDAQKKQARNQTFQLLVQSEPVMRQLGGKPLNVDKIREEAIKDAVPESEVQEYFTDAPATPPGAEQGLPQGAPSQNPTGLNGGAQ